MRRSQTVLLLVALLAAIGVTMLVAERAERVDLSGDDGPTGALRIEPPPGIYPRGARVTLSSFQTRGRIVVLGDGTVPSPTLGIPYQGPIGMRATSPGVRVLRAVEVYGQSSGRVLNASYVVGLEPSVPVLSIIAQPSDLWDAESGILANPTWRGPDWERPAHATLFLDGAVYALPLGIRVDGREPADVTKQTLRLYMRQEHGVSRFVAPIYPEHAEQPLGTQSYKRLLVQAGTHEVVWSLLRDHLAAEIARELDLPVAEGRFAWLFVNGTSWGLHRLTERVDRFMLADDFGLGEVDVVVEGDARDGSDEDWDTLVDWAAATDLADGDAMAQFEARVDLDNLTDYLALSRLLGFPAEALVAVRPAGGRWFWVFEGGPGRLVEEPDLSLLADALLRNADYRAQLARRTANIAATLLRPAAVDRHLAVLTPDMAQIYQHEWLRWPGAPLWEDEVTALRRVVEARRADAVGGGDVTASLTVVVPPVGSAALYVDGMTIESEGPQWQGVYGLGTAVDVTAVPAPGYGFEGWTVDQGDGRATTVALQVSLFISQAITLTPHLSVSATGPMRADPDTVLINEVWINDNGTRYRSLGDRALEGDWVELLVRAKGGADLRGYRLTDNDSLGADTEGSLIFPYTEVFADVPCGTVILLVATPSPVNAASFPEDDLAAADGRLILYVGNDGLDVVTDPGFAIGTGGDNLALLAPGPTAGLHDDVGVDFVAEGREVTPYSFGILQDGVSFDVPFRHLGSDDGALLRGRAGNDSIDDWIVDPSACESQDAACLDSVTLVTPGGLNPGQQFYRVGCLLSPPFP